MEIVIQKEWIAKTMTIILNKEWFFYRMNKEIITENKCVIINLNLIFIYFQITLFLQR
jgi:hypothetical protein